MRNVRRSGWGLEKTAVTSLGNLEEFSSNTRGESGLPVGLGRSYGDSALNSSGSSWSCLARKHISVDTDSQTAQVGAGVTIGELERAALPYSLFPPVVPGTEFVTIGGAIAADVHGKSHHKYGTFSQHVIELDLMDATGCIQTLTRDGDTEEEFFATAGGMGLTGIIVAAKVRLIPTQTSFFKVEEKRTQTIQDVISTINNFDSKYDYTVAWIDFSGDYRGRGVVTGGNHARLSDLTPKYARNPLKIKKPRAITIPRAIPGFLINRFTVRMFNELWFRKPLTNGLVHASKFLHPLDPVQKWNRIYGSKGFLQYQFVVPLDSTEFITDVLIEMRKIKAPSFISVLKKFEGAEVGYLSFPKPGWTLAIDVPIGVRGLSDSLDRLDKRVAELGGRIYLAKDSRLSIENFQQMYPRHSAWQIIKSKMDPENYWQSDQGRRLGLC